MNMIVDVMCEHGQIKGGWINAGLSFDFNGALFKDGSNILSIEFSVPFSFINKYGEQAVLNEIKDSVEGYIKTER